MRIWKWAALALGTAAVGSAAYTRYRHSIEEPDYTVEREDGAIELRAYEPLIVAETTHAGKAKDARSAGFRRLAAYIFAKDRPKADETTKIEMTAPVLQDSPAAENDDATSGRAGNAKLWRTRFVMPDRYTLEGLPTPPSDIAVKELPARRIAAIRFSGNGGRASLDRNELQLREWLKREGLRSAGGAEYAFYDPPTVPGPMRRNEILIPIAP